MINKEWIPFAVKIGIPINEFYGSTPRQIARRVPFYLQLRDKAERDREEMVSVSGWVNGLYVVRALATMSKKPYPKEPVEIFDRPEVEAVEEVTNPADGFRAWAIVYNDQRRRSRGEVMEDGEH